METPDISTLSDSTDDLVPTIQVLNHHSLLAVILPYFRLIVRFANNQLLKYLSWISLIHSLARNSAAISLTMYNHWLIQTPANPRTYSRGCSPALTSDGSGATIRSDVTQLREVCYKKKRKKRHKTEETKRGKSAGGSNRKKKTKRQVDVGEKRSTSTREHFVFFEIIQSTISRCKKKLKQRL